jgi:hypothetical protein
VAGCGGYRAPKIDRVPTVPAAGEITFDGKPIPGALVVLHPKDTSNPKVLPARGHVGADGKFVLSTYDTGDGAVPGQYAVTVEWYQLIKEGDSARPGPNVLPKKYATPHTSDIPVVTIADGQSTLPAIALKR